ncbi:MAG TPA: SCP2 sterol-binding domain-containing protein [Ilumatobacter sp.]
MHVFLSDEWMVAAHEIRERYETELPEITVSVRINQVITEVPFGDGTVHAYVDTSAGSFRLELGQLDEPDAVLMTDYATAKAMLVDQDPTVAMQSFMAGRIKVQGDMMKLMAMQTAMPANDFTAQLAAEIQAITA